MDDEKEPTQCTEKGAEIPISKRVEFDVGPGKKGEEAQNVRLGLSHHVVPSPAARHRIGVDPRDEPPG